MSVSVQGNIGAGGVDLSSLTSGERLLIGLLDVAGSGERNVFGFHSGNDGEYRELDMTKIASISFRSFQPGTYQNTLIVKLEYTTEGSSGYATIQQSIGDMGSGTLNCNQISADLRTACALRMDPASVRNSVRYYITAFSTTDGKVHTLANLNY